MAEVEADEAGAAGHKECHAQAPDPVTARRGANHIPAALAIAGGASPKQLAPQIGGRFRGARCGQHRRRRAGFDNAATYRDQIAKGMTPEQVNQAKLMVQAFTPKRAN